MDQQRESWAELKARLLDFCRYYRRFSGVFFAECYHAWRTQLLSTVAIAVISFAIPHKTDTKAFHNLVSAVEACGIWLLILAAYHLVRVPWLDFKKQIADKNCIFSKMVQEKDAAIAAKDAEIAAKQGGWNATKAELEEARKQPARFEITRRELRSFGPYGQDILLRAEIKLVTPVELAVERYSVKLSLDGDTESPTIIDDVRKWRVRSRSQNPSSSRRLVALPLSLRSGHPVEGWIHFATTRNEYEVRSGSMRLFVHSSRGDDFGDIPCSSEYWNVTRDNDIFFSDSDSE